MILKSHAMNTGLYEQLINKIIAKKITGLDHETYFKKK